MSSHHPSLRLATFCLLALTIAATALAQPAEAQGRLRVEVIETDPVVEGFDVDGIYELTASGGDISDISVSSSLCGPLTRPIGDDDDDDVLDEDETWEYDCSEAFDGTVDTVTAFGTDEDGAAVRDFDQRDIEFEPLEEDDEDEDEDEEVDSDPADDDAQDAEDDSAEDDGDDEGEDEAASDNDDDDSGINPWLFWGLLGSAVAIIALGLLYLLWRRGRTQNEERLFV